MNLAASTIERYQQWPRAAIVIDLLIQGYEHGYLCGYSFRTALVTSTRFQAMEAASVRLIVLGHGTGP